MDSTYNEIKTRVLLRNEASDVINNLPCMGYWVRDFEFKFLEISEQASKVLYNCTSDYCIGKSDIEIATNLGLLANGGEKQYVEVCRASDEYVLTNDKDGKYQVFRFIEMLKDTRGIPHIWRTIKGIYPSEVGCGKYFFGVAMFCDEIYGSYKKAYQSVQREMKHLTKINNNLYVYNHL